MILIRQQGMWLVGGLVAGAACGVLVVACGPSPDLGRNSEILDPATPALRGELIVPLVVRTAAPSPALVESKPSARPTAAPAPSATDPQPPSKTNEILKLGFDTSAESQRGCFCQPVRRV
jgi:hypothetical protein